jgi:hypothetical protein
MGIFEAILVGIQFKRLQKPLIFIVMLVAFILFTIFGLGVIAAGVEGYIENSKLLPAVGLASISILFFSLSALCGHFIKKCVI